MGTGPVELPDGMTVAPTPSQEADPAYITARAAWGVVDKPGARP